MLEEEVPVLDVADVAEAEETAEVAEVADVVEVTEVTVAVVVAVEETAVVELVEEVVVAEEVVVVGDVEEKDVVVVLVFSEVALVVDEVSLRRRRSPRGPLSTLTSQRLMDQAASIRASSTVQPASTRHSCRASCVKRRGSCGSRLERQCWILPLCPQAATCASSDA